MYLFECQTLGVGNDFGSAALMSNPCTEQLSQDRHDQMTMDADPTTAFKVIPAKLFLGLAKTGFHFPASKRDPQKITNRPPTSARHTVAQEVLYLTGANVRCDNERACFANKPAVVGLTVTRMRLDVPDFGAFVRVAYAVSLRRLISKGWRVGSQVANLLANSITLGEPRVDLLPTDGVSCRFLLNSWLADPNMKRWRDFANESQLSLIESIKKVSVSTVILVKRPRFHGNAIVDRLVDQF